MWKWPMDDLQTEKFLENEIKSMRALAIHSASFGDRQSRVYG